MIKKLLKRRKILRLPRRVISDMIDKCITRSENFIIGDYHYDFQSDSFEILIYSKLFDDVDEGQIAPIIGSDSIKLSIDDKGNTKYNIILRS